MNSSSKVSKVSADPVFLSDSERGAVSLACGTGCHHAALGFFANRRAAALSTIELCPAIKKVSYLPRHEIVVDEPARAASVRIELNEVVRKMNEPSSSSSSITTFNRPHGLQPALFRNGMRRFHCVARRGYSDQGQFRSIEPTAVAASLESNVLTSAGYPLRTMRACQRPPRLMPYTPFHLDRRWTELRFLALTGAHDDEVTLCWESDRSGEDEAIFQ
jgi:hypothetical protein